MGDIMLKRNRKPVIAAGMICSFEQDAYARAHFGELSER
jgi:hypothetical protein